MKYEINCHELIWHNMVYHVEADSEEEAVEMIENGEGELVNDNIDCTDQFDIESVTELQ